MDGADAAARRGTAVDVEELLRKEQTLRTLQEFALGMIEARTISELLWDVVGGAVARLGYQDCVIYLVDEERGCLVQRAAHGPKRPRRRVILHRNELAMGEGIVGAVAASGVGEIVPDVRQDSRYKIDDEPRASEMAVPIIHEGKVLGVLDSESPELDAYSADDLEIFRTIASMLATRIAGELERDRVEARLRQASYAAEEASRIKAAFLANVSHEIRTPLVAVLGMTEMLHGLIEGQAPREVLLDHLQVISRSGQHLLELINHLLDLSADEQGRLRIQLAEVDPVPLVREIGELFRGKAEAKGLALETEIVAPLPSVFRTDPTRVRQILVNLVDNAIKFTEAGSVRLRVTAPDGSRLRCEVADTGPGVPAEQRRRIFDSFRQADGSLARAHGGLGLGLAISRRIALRLGGKLWLEESSAAGSCFVLEVGPLAQPTANLEAEALPRPSGGPRIDSLRLLLAEDNADSRRLMQFQLEEAGHQVSAVADGEQAVEAVRRAPEGFDAILLDMQMPKRDGFSVAQELRRSGYREPIFALTAHTFPGDREQCLAAGCSDYLAKPFHWPELLRRLRRARSE